MIVGGTGGLVYWWDRWRYRTRVQIRDIKISTSQDNQHSVLSFEAENLGHSPTSIQSAVIVMGCGPKKERFKYTFTITSGDRNLPPNMPKTFVAQRPLPLVFEIVALWYRTHTFRLTRGRKVCVRLRNVSGTRLPFWHFHFERLLFLWWDMLWAMLPFQPRK